MKEVAPSHEFVTDLISIIVPVYNCEEYLLLCIESVINQSYKNIEIVISDQSRDKKIENVVNRFKDTLRITYLNFDKKDVGNAANINNAFNSIIKN